MCNRKTILKRALAWLCAFCCAATLLAGCSAPQESSAPASSDPGTPQYGGTLRLALGVAQSDSDLYPPTTATQNVLRSARPSLEPLFEIASDGTVLPFLVADYTVSEDGTVYTFHLQQNVQFSDGTPFDAEAVKWNFEQTQAAGINDFCDRIQEMTVVDEHTLEIRLAEPDILFIEMLAANKAGLMVSPTAVEENGAEWAKTHPVGTGPFVLESWDYGVEMVWKKNENYWQEGLPYLDGITFSFVNNNAVLRASYENDEYDMLCEISSALLASLNASGQRTTIYNYPNDAFNLWFPTAIEGSPFQDVRVRQAVCYAVDLPSIIQALSGSEFVSTNQLAYPGSDCWSDAITGYPQDVEKARQLLAEAGYADGFSTSIIAQNSEQNKLLCEAIQSSLKEIGIDLEVDLADEARYAENVILNSWGDGLALISYNFTPEEISSLVRMLNPDSCIFLHTVAFPEEYRTLFESLVSSTTMEQARETYKQIDALLIDDQALLAPVFIRQYATAQKETVHNTGAGLDGEVQKRYWTPEQIWLSQ